MTHPFVSLRSNFERLKYSQNLADEQTLHSRVLKSCLVLWQQAALIDELTHTFDLAYYLSWIIAVQSWQLDALDLEEMAVRPFRKTIPGKLRTFLALRADFWGTSQPKRLFKLRNI